MPKQAKKAVIIGGGIGGLATSILLAKTGWQVSLYEQQPSLGGRARQFKSKGFTFDMGPSWYLMPQVFAHYFSLIGEDVNDHLKLTKLNPAYKVFFSGHDPVTITGDLEVDTATFESIEKGSGKKLKSYLARAERTYTAAQDSYLYTNFTKPSAFLSRQGFKNGPSMIAQALQPIDKYVSKSFADQRLKQILEYPMVFLGTSPFEAPALYSLMSYMDFVEGVYYPMGGIHEVISSLESIARSSGVSLNTSAPIEQILHEDGRANGVRLKSGDVVQADLVVSNADLHFTETKLLDSAHQTYPESYWQKKQAGPSALLFYLGIKGELPQLQHHNLYFTDGWKENFDAIFEQKTEPKDGSLYICKPSATDQSVAPAGHENVFVLVPLPAKIMSSKEQAKLERYYMEKLKKILQEPALEERIVFKKIYGPQDFSDDYHSWQGSALGLSHSLRQSAVFRPRNKSKKLDNLYYVGGSTIPGVGLPMCLIGAELVYKHITNDTSSQPRNQL